MDHQTFAPMRVICKCPFLHCKALRTAMYKRYINSIIIILLSFKQNFTKPNKKIVTQKNFTGEI